MTVNFFVSLLQVLLGVTTESYVLNSFFKYESKKGKWRISAILFLSLLAVSGLYFCFDSETFDLFVEIILLFLFVCAPYVLFRIKRKLTFLLFGLTFCGLMDFVVFSVSSVFIQLSAVQSTLVYCSLYLLVMIMCGIVARRKIIIPENFLDEIPIPVYIVVYIASLATFYSITENTDPEYHSDVGNALMLISVVLVVTCISYAFYKFSALSRRQRETEKNLELQLKHYEDMVIKNRDIRAFRHDYKNNLISLRSLIDAGKEAEALEYIDGLHENLTTAQSRFSTGNYLADAILSDKSAAAGKAGAEIEFSGSIPQNGITNNDLCTVLANTVDNAIRGCADVEKAKIKIVGNETPNGFVLNVSNPVLNNVRIKNNTVKTSKSDKENHGFGIGIVKKTAKNYNGFVGLSCEDNVFKIEVGFILKGVG